MTRRIAGTIILSFCVVLSALCCGYDLVKAEDNAPEPVVEISLRSSHLIAGKSEGVSVTEVGVVTKEESIAVFGFEITGAGLYGVKIEYTTIEGKGSAIERRILIDGKILYPEMESVSLFRRFADDMTGSSDITGYRKRPVQSEVFGKYEQFIFDNRGYIDGPLQFDLDEGWHEIAFESIREPVIINSVTLCTVSSLPLYQDYYNEHTSKGHVPAENPNRVIIEAENAAYKTHSTLYPVYDRTSSLTSASGVQGVSYNSIGGINWRFPYQRITWAVSVQESGFYEIGIRFKQNFTEQNSVRTLYINGEVPFAEAKNIVFGYDNDWQLKIIGDDAPYKFYFEKNKTYDLALENSLGDVSGILKKSAELVADLNGTYRSLKSLIGNMPDINRDYNIEETLPEVIGSLDNQKEELKDLANALEALNNDKGRGYAAYQRLLIQIESFLADTDTIPARMNSFSTNISSLADHVYSASEQPLLLDNFVIQTPMMTYPRAKDTFFERLIYELKAFFVSFFEDYNLISGVSERANEIDLWMTTGRDQAETLRMIIDNNYPDEYQTGINVRLVAPDVILPAVAAGKGPDVAVGQEKTLPVKYGLRNSLIDLSGFGDLDEVLESFDSSAYASFMLDDGLYALPDSQNFLIMYVREDIFGESGFKVPETWDDMYSLLFDLQQKNMDIGLPNITEDNTEIFYSLLFQNGGTLFSEDLSRTRLDEEEAISAFTEWSRLYTKFKITEQMNHLTRFRTGDVPLVIANLSFYNMLTLSAPEIRGSWSIYRIPGTEQPDGTIDRSTGSISTGAVIFSNSQNVAASWDFLKWWVSDDTQLEYAREMENLQGAAGRIMLANKTAFNGMSWPVRDLKMINSQRESIVDVYEIAGSYVLDRYICTALRYTIEKNADPREILLDWNKKINTENEIRRREFGY